MRGKYGYFPLTESGVQFSGGYQEILPIAALSNVVRCFWGDCTQGSVNGGVVIPDTCADLLYHVDETTGTIASGGFCGVNDTWFRSSFQGNRSHTITTFGIRFYAWGAYAFAQDALHGTCNEYEVAENRFAQIDRQMRTYLPSIHGTQARAAFAERVLLSLPQRETGRVEAVVDNVLCHRGRMEVTALAQESFLSTRQLERLCAEYIGLSPKKLSELVRYQSVWQQVKLGRIQDVQTLVDYGGFCDQAHLLREFKRYHGRNLSHFFKTASDSFAIMEEND